MRRRSGLCVNACESVSRIQLMSPLAVLLPWMSMIPIMTHNPSRELRYQRLLVGLLHPHQSWHWGFACWTHLKKTGGLPCIMRAACVMSPR